jgi:pyruvate/2-oxoglutarate dehydrogenase complex dihydrolipoamide acyltransferase (E2) component
MSNMRIKIAEHMVMSKRVSAHVTTVHRVDMTKVAKARAKNKDEFAARHGMSLTFLPFVARAAAEALRHFPMLNASIDGNNIMDAKPAVATKPRKLAAPAPADSYTSRGGVPQSATEETHLSNGLVCKTEKGQRTCR